jgi:putative spermidine/putrescine transport system permease protein
MGRLWITASAGLALIYLALPLVVILGASLTSSQFLAFPPQGVTLSWYARVLADESYLAAFWTSSVLAAAAALGALLLGIPAALVIGRKGVPATGVIGAILMSPLVLPHVVLGAAFLQFCAAIGLVRTFWALLLGHVIVVTPFVMQAVLPLLTPEQRSLEEASRDLGAGWLATFRLVTLPTIRGGVVSGGLFAFISSWINVEMSMFNTTSAMTTVPVKLLNHVQYQVDPLIAAVSGLTIVVAAAAVIAIDMTIGLDVLGTRKH